MIIFIISVLSSQCNHGYDAKCLNCMGFEKKEEKTEEKKFIFLNFK